MKGQERKSEFFINRVALKSSSDYNDDSKKSKKGEVPLRAAANKDWGLVRR